MNIEGSYEGAFLRSSPNSRYAPSKVTLSLFNNEIEGESNTINYPGICSVGFSIEGNKVEFYNTCVWTADFDWTLILSGEYIFELSEDELTLKKTMGTSTDLYQLTRK